ncbi:MAG: hypothetical protein C0604_08060 [Clostridiales bacterium]|nr:MAG: hypothetical protein C0604_08060 [Clostridiales bacterium]
MEFELNSLLGMELDCGREMIESQNIHKNIVIKELVSPKYKGDRTVDVCRIVFAEIHKDDIVLTVSYF